MQRTPNHVRRIATAERRAAGVSPPYVGKRDCKGVAVIAQQTGDRLSANTVANALPQPRGGLRPPLLFRAPFARRRNCEFCDAQTHMHRSGGRQPAVFVGNARARMTTPGFTQRRRTRTRSGTRQPAVRRETRLQRRGRDCSADCLPCVSEHRCSRVAATTGAYAPALDGRCPLYRIRIAPMVRCRNYGGLTPPALVSRAIRPPTELRLLRCTNAHAQERREPAVWRCCACRGTRESHASAASCKVRNGAR